MYMYVYIYTHGTHMYTYFFEIFFSISSCHRSTRDLSSGLVFESPLNFVRIVFRYVSPTWLNTAEKFVSDCTEKGNGYYH